MSNVNYHLHGLFPNTISLIIDWSLTSFSVVYGFSFHASRFTNDFFLYAIGLVIESFSVALPFSLLHFK